MRQYLIAAILFLCSCRGCILGPDPFAYGSEYETYTGNKFIVTHYGEMDQVYIDTVIAISKIEYYDMTVLRLVNGDIKRIRTPDHVNKVEDTCRK